MKLRKNSIKALFSWRGCYFSIIKR